MLSRFLALLAALVGLAVGPSAIAQVPIPIQEQIEIFRSMPPAQQQALIRELQRNLPPAQRQAIIEMLQQSGPPGGTAEGPRAEGGDRQGLVLGPQLPRAGLDEQFQRLLQDRFSAEDWLAVEFTRREDAETGLSAEERERLDDFERRLKEGNPYQLDSSGRLLLPGVPPIPLAGLDVDQATVRLRTEPGLQQFDVTITMLPLEPVGREALEPFGYDLFDEVPTTFAPADDIPVPVDYVIGPGDTVYVQLFGNENAEYFLTVSREGVINFPEIGPITVSGLTFTDMRETINQRVAEQMIGTRASVTLGELRSIRVFVLGDVVRPGSYTVSGLSTMTNALFASGGVKSIGSLRNIRLMRNGETIGTLDLYDLLLRGDTSADQRLQPGDAIFVPPIGPTVAVDGEVRRPAIYEVKNERSVADLIALAGGLNPNANRSAVKLERVVPNRGTTVQDIDLTSPQAGSEAVRDGDAIRVLANLDQLENAVRLTGNVYNEGLYQWFPGMRLSDLLPSPEQVRPMSDVNYVLIRREVAPNVDMEVLSADLGAIWQRRPGARDVELQARDTVYVFNLESGRQHIVEPIIEQLERQAASNAPTPVVRVAGQVRAPGDYPLEPGMRISDLVRAGGGLGASAYTLEAELTRYSVVNGEYRETELINVNLAAALRGDPSANLLVAPYDYLNIKEVPRWRSEGSVTLRGEVVFPGTYPIRQGEMLSSVLARAGGLTSEAFAEGSVFTRVELREREREQIETLARRIETDLASLSLSDTSNLDAVSVGQSLVTQLREAVPTGRLVIRLDEIVAGVPGRDIILRDGDELLVPPITQSVTVLGEVQYPTSHVFERGLDRDDYIAKSGGVTRRADESRIYVVRANGEVVAGSGARWFRRGTGIDVRPGDTIVVPLDVDRVRPLARWSAVTQVVYNLAIAAAAVNSF